MHRKMILGALMAGVAALALPGGLAAHGGKDGGRFMERIDADKDGFVSQSEFAAMIGRGFERMDPDGAGAVTRAEFQERLANPEKPELSDEDEAKRAERHAAYFKKLDKDGNGSLSAEEMGRKADRLSALDKDGDGALSQQEFDAAAAEGWHKQMSPEKRAKMAERALSWFDRIDADKDGTVTKAEAEAAGQAKFASLDKDGDGKLSPDELRAGHRGKSDRSKE